MVALVGSKYIAMRRIFNGSEPSEVWFDLTYNYDFWPTRDPSLPPRDVTGHHPATPLNYSLLISLLISNK